MLHCKEIFKKFGRLHPSRLEKMSHNTEVTAVNINMSENGHVSAWLVLEIISRFLTITMYLLAQKIVTEAIESAQAEKNSIFSKTRT